MGGPYYTDYAKFEGFIVSLEELIREIRIPNPDKNYNEKIKEKEDKYNDVSDRITAIETSDDIPYAKARNEVEVLKKQLDVISKELDALANQSEIVVYIPKISMMSFLPKRTKEYIMSKIDGKEKEIKIKHPDETEFQDIIDPVQKIKAFIDFYKAQEKEIKNQRKNGCNDDILSYFHHQFFEYDEESETVEQFKKRIKPFTKKIPISKFGRISNGIISLRDIRTFNKVDKHGYRESIHTIKRLIENFKNNHKDELCFIQKHNYRLTDEYDHVHDSVNYSCSQDIGIILESLVIKPRKYTCDDGNSF